MVETGKYFPNEANLGRECAYWNNGCIYPKFEMEGRTSCEGIVDDVCLFLKIGRRPASLTEAQITELKTEPPSVNKFHIPPGDIK